MEEEGIGLVLARATELRLKISNCVHRGAAAAAAAAAAAITRAPPNGLEPLPTHHEHEHGDGNADDDEDEAAERLVNICDALESLETQLSSLQVLQQQQQYEREIALIEIESSRKMLIDKLKEYKGKELEVIHEASTFASETVEHSNDLLLPPYPSRPPYSMCLDKEYLSQIPSVNKSVRNGLITLDPLIEAKKSLGEKEQNHVPVKDGATNSRKKRFGYFVTAAAKTMLTAVGVVSILSLSGYGPNWVKLGVHFNVKGQFQRPNNEYDRPVTENEDGRPIAHCPPGRVLVLENGEARCLVKERVEIPFSAAAATPDINYGCG